MLKNYTYLLGLLVVVLGMFSCHNDIGEVNPATEVTNQITVPLEFDEVEGDLIGFVYNTSNVAIPNASVRIYSDETTTNEFGAFSFEDVKLDPQGTYIQVEKSGFLLGSDLVYPNSDGKGTSKVVLLSVQNNPSFQASTGGVIQIEGGGTLSIPPSGLIRPNGSIYDGEVRYTAYKLSHDDSNFGAKMSGGLLGLDENGKHRVLTTFGIIAIQLTSFDNQILRLKSDKEAELSLPIDPEIQSLVSTNLSIWNFDSSDGLWYERPELIIENQQFNSSIKTLGFWNIAAGSDVSQVCGRLVYTNELPVKNYTIQIEKNGLPSRVGITDQDGYFCGKMPKGEDLKLQVLHPLCGNVLMELEIGPFEEVGTIGNIILESEEKYISGKVECGGEGFNETTIITQSNGKTNFFYPNANGTFSLNLQEVVCGQSTSFSIFAYDNSSGMSSEVFDLDVNFSEALKLEVCQVDCEASRNFIYERENYCEDGEYNKVTIEVVGGSGNYSYVWQNGSTEASFSNPPTGQEICVNVVDESNGCQYNFCDLVPSYRRLTIESLSSSNSDCLITSGYINLEVEGGKEPLSYNWIGPDGFESEDPYIEGLSPGLYELQIEDDAGCMVNETVEVFDVTVPIESTKEDLCALSIVTIVELDGYKPYTYTWSAGEVIGNQLFVSQPGSYSLTMTDANLCTRNKTFNIFNVGSLPEINPTYGCNSGIVTLSDLETGFDYFYQPFGSSEKIPLDLVGGTVEIDVFESGYRFELGSEVLEFGDCSTSLPIELPYFEGLEIGVVSNTSCESCEDGRIDYELIMGADCSECSVGEVVVLNAENGEDVTELNEEGQLEKGAYYVVVLDENSGCFIAHSLVEVE